MGTNFHTVADSTCDNPSHDQMLHIGKSSLGWKFGFRAYDDLGLVSWAAWRTYLRGRRIVDEYGETLTVDEFADIVENRRTPDGEEEPYSHANPSPGCIVRGFGGFWSPIEHDDEGRPDRFEDADGYDFSRRSFS